jgi:hypothetical protein
VFVGNQSDYTIDGGTPIGWPSWLRVTNNATGNVSWLQTVERVQFADRTIDAPGLLPTALGTAGADVIKRPRRPVIHGLAGDDRSPADRATCARRRRRSRSVSAAPQR